MKIHIITTDIFNPEFIKFFEAVQANGHIFVESISDADLIVVGPDIKAKFSFVGNPYKETEFSITYKNWLAKHFEGH